MRSEVAGTELNCTEAGPLRELKAQALREGRAAQYSLWNGASVPRFWMTSYSVGLS